MNFVETNDYERALSHSLHTRGTRISSEHNSQRGGAAPGMCNLETRPMASLSFSGEEGKGHSLWATRKKGRKGTFVISWS